MNLVHHASVVEAGASLVNLMSDGAHLYFNGNALYRLPLQGGDVETVFAGPFAGGFATTSGRVAYETVAKRATGADAWVYEATGIVLADAQGSRPIVTLSEGTTFEGPVLVAPNGDVFFSTAPVDNGNGGAPSAPSAQRWDAATQTTTELPGVPVVDWYDRGQLFYGTASGGIESLYVVDATGSAGAAPRKLTDRTSYVAGFDATNVYWTESLCPEGNIDGPCNFRIHGIARDGSSPSFVAYESDRAYGTAWTFVDDSGVYWADWQTHDVTPVYHANLATSATAARAAGAPDVVVSDAHGAGPGDYTVDACNVYWLERDANGGPRVMAVTK